MLGSIVSVDEARPVVDVGRTKGAPGKTDIPSYVERVALIVVEEKVVASGERSRSGHRKSAIALGNLVA